MLAVSIGHKEATKTISTSQKSFLQAAVEEQCNEKYAATTHIFRTAYFIAYNNKPYTDHPELIDLQKLNCVKVGRILHSNVTCANIIDHISKKMQNKIMQKIIETKQPFSILIDESTSFSKKSNLIVYIRSTLDVAYGPITLFMNLIELSETNAEGITGS